jgi:hypothetical protein
MKYFTIEEIKKYLPKKHVDLSKMKYFTIEEIKKYLPKKHVDLSKMKYFTDENAKFITDLYKKYYMTVPVTLPKNKYKIHITCDSQYVPKKNEIIFYINGTTITTNRREYGGNFRTLPNADPMHSVITQMSGKDVTPSKYNNLMSELMHSKFLLYDLELGSHFYMDDLSQQKIDKVIKNNIAKFNELFGLISAINGRLLNVKGDTNLNTTNNDYIYAIAPFIVGKGGKKITDYLCTEVANKIKTKLISDNPNSFQSENEKKRKIEDQKDNNSEKKQKTEDPKDPQEEHVSKTQKRI